MVVIIILVILIIASAGGAYWYINSDDTAETKTETKTPVIPDPNTETGTGTGDALGNGESASAEEVADAANETGATLAFASEAERTKFLESLKARKAGTSGLLANYMFVQGADTYGFDLGRVGNSETTSPEVLAAACNAKTGCVGFNHQGYLKSKVYSPQNMNRYVAWASRPEAGLYYRTGTTPISSSVVSTMPDIDGYDNIQGLDMVQYDLPSRTDLSGKPTEIAKVCSSTSGCVGFNTLGYLKSTTFDPNYMVPVYADDSKFGFYYLAGSIIKPAIQIYTTTSGDVDKNTVQMGFGSGTLTNDAKYIRIPRNIAVRIVKTDGGIINLRGPTNGAITGLGGAFIEVLDAVGY